MICVIPANNVENSFAYKCLVGEILETTNSITREDFSVAASVANYAYTLISLDNLA